MAKKRARITKRMQDYVAGVASEDGKHYRVERQELDPILERVEFLSEKVNTAPKAGNTNDMRYIGSIPMTVLWDWCRKVGIGLDAYARDQFGEKDMFLSYLKTEFPLLLAKKRKSSQIVVPGRS